MCGNSNGRKFDDVAIQEGMLAIALALVEENDDDFRIEYKFDFEDENDFDDFDDFDYEDATEEIAVSANSDGSIVASIGDQQLYLADLTQVEELIDKLSWAADAAWKLEDRTPF